MTSPTPDRAGAVLSLIVLTNGPVRQMSRALAVAEGCTAPDIEVVETGNISSGTTGEALNAAVRCGTAPLFAVIDGSEQLSLADMRAGCDLLYRDCDAGYVVGHPAPMPWLPDADEPRGVREVLLADLLGGPWTLSRAALIRRSAFDESGGYEDSLPALHDWDLRLRFLSLAVRGLVMPRIISLTSPKDDVRLREALRPDRYLPAVRRIVGRHESLFLGRAAIVLSARNRLNDALWRHERELGVERTKARAELDAVTDNVANLRRRLLDRGLPVQDWSDLRRIGPVSRLWGSDRGRPIDRHYIDRFIQLHAEDVKGVVLEMLDADMTRRFGGAKVTSSDVMDIDPGNVQANIIGDLRSPGILPVGAYDCIIVTQTLHLIDDIQNALKTLHDALAPGGVLLATFPTASMVASEYGPAGDHWRLTPAGARWLCERVFDRDEVDVQSHGNVLAVAAFLQGLCCDDVEIADLDAEDSDYPLVVTVRAVRRRGTSGRPQARTPASDPAVLLYHRATDTTYDPFRMAVQPRYLREHLEIIKAKFRPLSLSELAEAARSGSVPDRAVAVTFDDGYVDNLSVVAPLLAEFQIPATFFLTSESLDHQRRYWWDVLAAIFAPASDLPPDVVLSVGGRAETFMLGDPDARGRSVARLHAILMRRMPAERDSIIRDLETAMGAVHLDAGERPLMADEITRLSRAPFVEVGAHSVHHVALPDLDEAERHREVFECRTSLERLTGGPVTLFAYPFGLWSPEAYRTVVSADYRFAVTCDARRLGRRDQPGALPRLQVPDVAGKDFLTWLS